MKEKLLRKSALLMSFGAMAFGCGGMEASPETPTKLDARTAAQQGLLVKNPQVDVSNLRKGDKTAQGLDISYFQILYVCVRINNEDYCEDVQGRSDTYYDWDGEVGIWTYEEGYAGSYHSSFNSVGVNQDEFSVYAPNGVMQGMSRHYTLQNVTSGNFSSQVISAYNNSVWSDSVWIW